MAKRARPDPNRQTQLRSADLETWAYSPDERFALHPRPPGSWTPPAGEAALELLQVGQRRMAIVCVHGGYAIADSDQIPLAEAMFLAYHSECRLHWVRSEFSRPMQSVEAGLAVTGTPPDHPAVKAALARVHATARYIERWLGSRPDYPCPDCSPSLVELRRTGEPDAQPALRLLHAVGCRYGPLPEVPVKTKPKPAGPMHLEAQVTKRDAAGRPTEIAQKWVPGPAPRKRGPSVEELLKPKPEGAKS